ncbi:MAG: hypothetical protein NZ699_07100 [Roseiflexus sp.]|nr:hypothetical protein [Roseiflexus sp.]MDW8146852.1 hypothetical protein [Roseiflexaceae bacterium]
MTGDERPPPVQPGQATKEHYAHTKPGSCALLAAIAPRTGRWIGKATHRRAMAEHTRFRQARAAQYPDAVNVRVVQDALTTHPLRASYTFACR